jgi:predicted dienelactone hydrolase
MKQRSWILLLVGLLLVACSSSDPTELSAAATEPPATNNATVDVETFPAPGPFLLSEPGAYQFGTRWNIKFTDASRSNRELGIYVWYPAVLPEGTEPNRYNFNADPDLSGAPYPVILSSAKSGTYFGSHLASHGFVVIGADGQDSKDHLGKWLIDYPLDQVFALEQVASTPLEGLEGMLDTDRVGAMGYSFGGYNALALGGARIDPDFYQAKCAAAVPHAPAPQKWWIEYECDLDGGWEALVNHAGPEITTSTDGLWQPLTDARIQAVMPMVPEGAWLFGERGLAAVDRPTLILAGTADDINYYDLEAVYIFEHLTNPDKAMISFIGRGHMIIFDDEQLAVMKHFATAFFGYHLQDRDDYEGRFSEEFVSKQQGLAWGVYDGE